MHQLTSLPNWAKWTRYLSSEVPDDVPSVGDPKKNKKNQAVREILRYMKVLTENSCI